MIYNWIQLQNGYEYALAPQYRIANCDDYITSNLLGRDLNFTFSQK